MSDQDPTIYLNGEFLPLSKARVPVLDRGFLFGDGVYEVIPVYGGKPLRLEEHLRRLDQSLAGIRMLSPYPDSEWSSIFDRLINGNHDQQIYLQVTRGADLKRDHAIPSPLQPTVFVMCTAISPIPLAGIKAVTVKDTRWDRCNIKAITLLANVLLRQEALDEGAAEAILVRDGLALEGSASNIFLVKDGRVITPPKGPSILPGITRDLVLELAAASGFPTEQRDIRVEELSSADEFWITSSTREILAVIELDGHLIHGGQPGPVWHKVLKAYQDYKSALREAGTSL